MAPHTLRVLVLDHVGERAAPPPPPSLAWDYDVVLATFERLGGMEAAKDGSTGAPGGGGARSKAGGGGGAALGPAAAYNMLLQVCVEVGG